MARTGRPKNKVERKIRVEVYLSTDEYDALTRLRRRTVDAVDGRTASYPRAENQSEVIRRLIRDAAEHHAPKPAKTPNKG